MDTANMFGFYGLSTEGFNTRKKTRNAETTCKVCICFNCITWRTKTKNKMIEEFCLSLEKVKSVFQ